MLNERYKCCLLNNVNPHFVGCELWLVVLEADKVMNTRLHLGTRFLCALPPQAHPKACSWHQGLTSNQRGLQLLCAEQLSTVVTASSRQTQTFPPALQGTLTMGKQAHIQPHPRQTGGIGKPGWRSPRDPDTAEKSRMLEVSVTQLSPALISSWLKLQVLDICAAVVMVPSCRALHTAPLCFRDVLELCPWCRFKPLTGLPHPVCGRSRRRTPFSADQDTPSAFAWPCCECGRVWYQMALRSAQLLELSWAQGELRLLTQMRERDREAVLSALHFEVTWEHWWDGGWVTLGRQETNAGSSWNRLKCGVAWTLTQLLPAAWKGRESSGMTNLGGSCWLDTNMFWSFQCSQQGTRCPCGLPAPGSGGCQNSSQRHYRFPRLPVLAGAGCAGYPARVCPCKKKK